MTSNKLWSLERIKAPTKKRLTIAVASATALLVWSSTGNAFQFDIESTDWDVRWDNTLRYNASFRVQKAQDWIAKTDASNSLFDDASQAFSRGLVSNRIDLISEFDVIWKRNFGFRVSGTTWYDDVYNNDSDYPSKTDSWGTPSAKLGEFTKDAERLHGQDGEIMDAFVFGNFTLGNTELGVRAGRHALYWGQSALTIGGVHGIAGSMSTIDAIKAFSVPGSELQELFMPSTKVSTSWQLNPNLAINGYYSLEFREYRMPAPGTYFSPAEYVTNADDIEFVAALPLIAFGAPAGSGAVGLIGDNGETPGSGEWGLALEYYWAGVDMDIGLYYLNYHDKLPNGFVAELNVEQLPAALGGIGLLPPTPVAPNNLGVGRAKNTYKEDIDLYGLSFAKEKWGVSWAGDIVYRKDAPLNPNALAILTGRPTTPFLCSVGHPSCLDSGYDALDESNYGGPTGDTYHVVLNAFGFLPTNALWDGGSYIAELSLSTLGSLNKKNEQFLNANVEEDDVAAHLAVNFTPEWYNVFPQHRY